MFSVLDYDYCIDQSVDWSHRAQVQRINEVVDEMISTTALMLFFKKRIRWGLSYWYKHLIVNKGFNYIEVPHYAEFICLDDRHEGMFIELICDGLSDLGYLVKPVIKDKTLLVYWK